MSDFFYKKEDGLYSLYEGGECVYCAGEEVALSYVFWEDENGSSRGFINKHGSVENVKSYHDLTTSRYQDLSKTNTELAKIALDVLNETYYISGKFELDDLNNFLSISDSIARWHKKNIA